MASAAMSRCRSPVPSTVAPSTARIVSVGRSPARSAGLPDGTSMTPTPLFCPSSSARARDSGRPPPTTPRYARRTRPSRSSVATMSSVVALTGHGQAEADPGQRRVDPDQAGPRVDQRAAGVAGVQRGVGLDDVLHDPPA